MTEEPRDARYCYPQPYELEQTLAEFCPRTFVQGFAQRQGVILTNATHSDIAAFLSELFLSHDDLDRIRAVAFRLSDQGSLAGFVVRASDADFDLAYELDQYRNQIVDERKNMRLGPLVQRPARVCRGEVSYTDLKPGRIEFLQGMQRSFRYTVRPTTDGAWQVLVECDRSNDARIMEEWLKRSLARGPECLIEIVDQSVLTSRQTVQFFDRVSQEAMGEHWLLQQVTRLVLRRATDDGEDEAQPVAGEEDEIEVTGSQLAGITQAILDGESLRENPFVKQCEAGGYRFTAMTCQYEHREHALVAAVRAEFKERPKVFEVALVSYQTRRGLGEELVDAELGPDGSEQLLASYWGRAKRIYDEITST